MREKKKQHYVSQCILKHFATEKKQASEIYFKDDNIYSHSIKHCMEKNNNYEHPFLKPHALEDFFGVLETEFSPMLERLIKEIEVNPFILQNKKQTLLNLVPYYIFFYFRSEALLEEGVAASKTKEGYEKIERMLINIADLDYVFELAETIINGYDCAVIADNKERFVISDQCLSTAALKYKGNFVNASNRQIGMDDTIILLPLSSKYYAVFYNGNIPTYINANTVTTLSDRELEEINNIIFQNSYIKCLCRTKDELIRLHHVYPKAYQPCSTTIKYDNFSISIPRKKEVFFYKEDEDLFNNYDAYCQTYIASIRGKINENDKCICGSGKTYKECCKQKYEIIENILLNKGEECYLAHGAKIMETSTPVLSLKYRGKFIEYKNNWRIIMNLYKKHLS